MLMRNDTTYGPRLMNCWLPADTWVEALQKTGHIDAALAIDTRKFNAAFAKSASFGSLMSRFDGSNHTGVFHVRYQQRQYYYFTEEKRQVSYPFPLNKAWKERVLEAAANVFSIPSTMARPAAITVLANDTSEANDADCDTSDQPSPRKRPRIEIVEEPKSMAHSCLPDSPEARQVLKPTTGRSAYRVKRSAYSGVSVGDSSAVLNETAKEALE